METISLEQLSQSDLYIDAVYQGIETETQETVPEGDKWIRMEAQRPAWRTFR